MKPPLGHFVLALVTFGLFFPFIEAARAFDKGDEVYALRDTDAYFNDKLDHSIKRGEKITVYQHNKDTGKVYFLSTDSEGKQLALYVSEGALGTKTDYSAILNQQLANNEKYINELYEASGVKNGENVKQAPSSICGAMIAIGWRDQEGKIHTNANGERIGTVQSDSVELADNLMPITLAVQGKGRNGEDVVLIFTTEYKFLFHVLPSQENNEGRFVLDCYPLKGPKKGTHDVLELK